MTTAPVRMTLHTRGCSQVLTAGAEREVAPTAKSILLLHAGETLRVGFAVVRPDPDARQQITFSLTDLALELDLA